MSNTLASKLERMRDLFPPFRASGRAVRSGPGVVFDPAKCTGCGICESVCAGKGLQPQGGARTPRIRVLRDECAGTSFTVLCQHCLDPLCLKTCPTGAISKGKDGVVRMDKRLCVNCGLCIAACPEAAPRRVEGEAGAILGPPGAAGAVVKCDLCEGSPACVEACPHKALSYTKGRRPRWLAFVRWPVQMLSFLLLVVVLVGSVCSLNIATLDLACPFGVLQNVFSTKAILLTALVSGLLLIGLAFVLGRVFCGWMCPFGFILDLADLILPRRLFRLPSFVRNRLNKYGVGLGGMAIAGTAGTQVFCTVCPIGAVCRSYGFNSIMSGAETAIIPAIALLDGSEKRTWCRYLCPVGACFALAAKFGLVRVDIGAPRCKKFSCMRCASVCPMGIIPEEQLVQGISPKIDMSECILCLRCVSACPHGAASVRFVWQKPRIVPGKLPVQLCAAQTQRGKI